MSNSDLIAQLKQQLGGSIPNDFKERDRSVTPKVGELFSLDDALQYSRDYQAPVGILYLGTWGGGNFWMLDVREGKSRYIDAPASAHDYPDKQLGRTYSTFAKRIS